VRPQQPSAHSPRPVDHRRVPLRIGGRPYRLFAATPMIALCPGMCPDRDRPSSGTLPGRRPVPTISPCSRSPRACSRRGADIHGHTTPIKFPGSPDVRPGPDPGPPR
jgi:hypothetical protein